jgi:hypothetical protein
MKPEYIFICGVSRSGTTLLLKMLNRSPEVALCPESFFLGHQLPWDGVRHVIKRQAGDLSKDANVHKLAILLYEGDFNRDNQGYWRWLRRKTSPVTFLEKTLAVEDRTDREIFAIMMEMRGDWARKQSGNVNGDLILGEKTPSHIYYVPTLLEWFPNSRIIHMLRDPRGVFASELRRRKAEPLRFPYKQLHRTGPLFTIFILLQVTYTWLRAGELHFKYQQLYPDRYYLLRFEDLVTDPETRTRELCRFLEVDFREALLEQRVVSRGFSEGQAGIESRAADRWKDLNPRWINSWFLFWGNEYLERLGYSE